MFPTIFVSLAAIMPGHLEPAFLSLMALQTYGIGAPLTADEQMKFSSCLTDELVAFAENHGARIVFTSIHEPDVEAAFIRQHLNNLGLPGIANHLSENWSTSMQGSSSRAADIRSWLRRYGSAQDAYVILETAEYLQELSESDLAENVLIIDSENHDFSAVAKRVRQVLETGAGHA